MLPAVRRTITVNRRTLLPIAAQLGHLQSAQCQHPHRTQVRQLWWRRSSNVAQASEEQHPQLEPKIPPSATAFRREPTYQPVDFDVQAKIEGNETQVLTVELQRGQRLRAEAGNLIYMTEGVVLDTSTGGGVGKALSRVITGQSVMVTDFFLEPTSRRTSSGRESRVGHVCLGTSMPAKILRLPLADFGGSVVCQRGAFLAGSDTIDITTEVTRPMAGLFGGEGFVLQRLSGEGDAFVSACGHVMRRDLKSGEVLRVTAGSLVCFSSTVDYGVTTAGGLKNIVFGTDGVFLATLTGPGTVYLQGMPFDRLVRAIGKALPQNASGMPVPPIILPGMGGGDSGNAPPGDAKPVGGAAPLPPVDHSGASQSTTDLYGDVAPGKDEIIQGHEEFDFDTDEFDDDYD